MVAALKQRHGVRYVYAWHAMAGFWGGLGLADPEMARYQPQLVFPKPTSAMMASRGHSWIAHWCIGSHCPGCLPCMLVHRQRMPAASMPCSHKSLCVTARSAGD